MKKQIPPTNQHTSWKIVSLDNGEPWLTDGNDFGMNPAAAPNLLEALKNLLEILDWLGNSGNLNSPIEPHPYGLAVIMAKNSARGAIAKATGRR